MTDVIVSNIDVVVEVQQPTVPPTAPPAKVGLVEINQVVQRGSAWMTGHGPPSAAGGQTGDMYLDMDTGDVYLWDGAAWDFQGTFAPSTLTPEEILEALLTVDGPGSLLDADLLDGQHGIYYATKTSVDAVVTKNTEQDAAIQKNIDDIYENSADIADLVAADTALAARVTATENVNTSQTTAINANATAISTETTNRTNADTALDAKITTEKNRNDAQDTAINLRLTDAPSNTNAYGRKAAAWVDVTEEAPADGLGYMRKNGAWTPSSGGATTDDAPPAGPLQDGQFWWKSSTGVLYLWYDDGNSQQWVQVSASPQVVDNNYARKTARPGNRIVNPCAQVVTDGTAPVTTTSAYPADQWVFGIGGIVGQAQRVAINPSPDGATIGVTVFATTAKPTLAATDSLSIQNFIEGIYITDFLWGTANARPAVLRFNAIAAVAGKYGVSVRNGAGDRCYLTSFDLPAANQWTTVVLPIPGDITGTWATGNTLGAAVRIFQAAGASTVGVPGWQAGNLFVPPGCINGAAVANSALWITDLGLYVDPDNTGLAPPWETPNFAEEQFKCQRYYRFLPVSLAGYGTASGNMQDTQPLAPQMRTVPVVGIQNAGSVSNIAAAELFPTVDRANMSIQPSAVGTMAVYNRNYSLNARM